MKLTIPQATLRRTEPTLRDFEEHQHSCFGLGHAEREEYWLW